MDLLYHDMSDLRSETDPNIIIKLLYGNTLGAITPLLEPYLEAVKKAAGRYCPLGFPGTVGEAAIRSADSVHSLLSLMSVMATWDNTRFLRKAVGSIPLSTPERGVAETFLLRYNNHLENYRKSTLLTDDLAKRKDSKSEDKGNTCGDDAKLVPLEITSLKAIGQFSCEDYHSLQERVLHTSYGVPEESSICHDAEERHSTTVTFLIPDRYTHNIVQRSTQLPTVWVLLEMGIIQVCIPKVFTFSPSVSCFLAQLRGKKAFTADFLGVTEVRALHFQHSMILCVYAQLHGVVWRALAYTVLSLWSTYFTYIVKLA